MSLETGAGHSAGVETFRYLSFRKRLSLSREFWKFQIMKEATPKHTTVRWKKS